MKQLYPDLWQSTPEHPFGNAVKTCAYLLTRPDGNLLLYSSGKLPDAENRIRELGGITRQYLNHRDEASANCQWVTDTFDAPLICHEAEKDAVAKHCTVAETFNEAMGLQPDLRAVPTPGHATGSTCYLWQAPDQRYLFTGDTIYLNDGHWQVFIKPENSDIMITSLKHIAELDFDVLVPGLFSGEISHMPVTKDEVKQQTEQIIQRLRQGEIH